MSNLQGAELGEAGDAWNSEAESSSRNAPLVVKSVAFGCFQRLFEHPIQYAALFCSDLCRPENGSLSGSLPGLVRVSLLLSAVTCGSLLARGCAIDCVAGDQGH